MKMRTRLQKLIDTIEDRHIGEPIGKRKHRVMRDRGSILNATHKELAAIRKLSTPMNKSDK